MARRVHCRAHGADVARDSGGRLIVDDQDAFDLVARVLRQDLADALGRRAFAPVHVEDVHPQAVPLRQVDPEMAELAVARGDDPIPR